MTESLQDAIDRLVQEKTFGLDALDGVRSLKTKAAEQDAKIAALNRTLEQRGVEIVTARARISSLEREIEINKARETALEQREAKVRDLELKEAVSTAKGETLGKVFDTIFGNVRVRETAVRQLPFTTVEHGRSYTGFQQAHETVERVNE